MQFNKRSLCTNISLILSAGLLAIQPLKQAHGQTGLYSCRPNDAGDGWNCVTTDPASQGQPLTNDRFIGSDNDLFSDNPDSAQGLPGTPAPSEANATSPVVLRRTASDMDWISREQLSAEEQANIPGNCCGAFIEPQRVGIDTDADPATSDTVFQTSSQTALESFADGTIMVNGQITVQQGNRTVSNTQETTINGETGTVLMEGDVEFREPGVLLRGSSAFIDQETGNNRLENARYVLHDYGIHGSAQSLVYTSETNFLTIVNGEFSRCEPDSNFWRISAKSILLDQTVGRGYARGASLRIKNIPVFYYPFTLTFPLGDERLSGFLAPSSGSTRDGGFDFELPYYFNLAPNYDATLSPRLISDRGVLVNAEARYLANWSMNTVNLSHLAGDKKFELTPGGLPTVESPPKEDRWFLGYEHFGVLTDNWSSTVDYNVVSDSDYFEDLGSSGLNVASRTHLNRQGRIEYRNDLFQAGVNVQRIDILDPLFNDLVSRVDLNKPFDRLPQLEIGTDFPLLGNLRFGLQGEFTSFDRNLKENLLSQDQIQSGALVNGMRVNLEPELTWNFEAPGWFVKPTVKYKHVSYDLENQAQATTEDPDIGVGVYSLDAGLIFDRAMGLSGGGFTQTLEPRLYYLNTEYEDQSLLPLFDTSEYNFSFNQLFRDDRFSGGDRIGDADQLTAAITSRVLDPQGRERARVSIGQITYFEDRLVNLSNPLQTWIPKSSPSSSTSALVGEFSYSFSDKWQLYADVQWNEDQQKIDEGSFQFHFQSDNNLILNVAYRYQDILTLPPYLLSPAIDTRIKQTDVSAVWPLNNNWRLLGRWNYDHSNSRNLESFAGVEFSNCCATIRLIAREWVRQHELFQPTLDSNRGVFFQFTLNGLGNITGGGLSNLLNDSIIGFRDPY